MRRKRLALESLESRQMLTTLDFPDTWYVGDNHHITGSAYPPSEWLDIVITLSDDSTIIETDRTDSSGNLSRFMEIEPTDAGGEATIEVYDGSQQLFIDCFDVVNTPTLMIVEQLGTEFGNEVPLSSIDVQEFSYWIMGKAFQDYDNQEIFVKIQQGDEWYLRHAFDEEPDNDGQIEGLLLIDDDDWFDDQTTLIAHLESGEIIAANSLSVLNATASPPISEAFFAPSSINITTPSTFREGDYFTIDVDAGMPNAPVIVSVIGDGNVVQHTFNAVDTDSNGDASLSLRLPYVLDPGQIIDGKTVRVEHVGYVEDFGSVQVTEGQRVGLIDSWEEGEDVEVEVRNGEPSDTVIFQLVHDDDVVVHEWTNQNLDTTGYGQFTLTMPRVLGPTFQVDGYTFRSIADGLVTDKSVTITEGLRVVTGAENVREGHTFHVEIRNGAVSTGSVLEWYLDETYIQDHPDEFCETNGQGYVDCELTMPDLIPGGGPESDLYTLKVSHDNENFELDYTVYQSSTPDPGANQADPPSDNNEVNSMADTSILGLALQILNEDATLEDVHNAVGTVLADDEDFNAVLSLVTCSVESGIPQDGVDIADLLAAVTVSNLSSITPLLSSGCGGDHRFLLPERTKHQLVILVYGADQSDSSDPSKTGMIQVYNDIVDHVANGHVLRFASGNKAALGSTETAYVNAQTSIATTLNNLASSGEGVDSVVIAGYSWGAGMAKRLSEWFDFTYPAIEVSGLVYVDAVAHNTLVPLNALPSNASELGSALVIYQSDHHAIVDSVVDGPQFVSSSLPSYQPGGDHYGYIRQFDTDAGTLDSYDHVTIDEATALIVSRFITYVLDEWFWTDLFAST